MGSCGVSPRTTPCLPSRRRCAHGAARTRKAARRRDQLREFGTAAQRQLPAPRMAYIQQGRFFLHDPSMVQYEPYIPQENQPIAKKRNAARKIAWHRIETAGRISNHEALGHPPKT